MRTRIVLVLTLSGAGLFRKTKRARGASYVTRPACSYRNRNISTNRKQEGGPTASTKAHA